MSRRRWFSVLFGCALLATAGCGGAGIGGLEGLIDGVNPPSGDDPDPSGPPDPAATMSEQELSLAVDCFQRVNAERAKVGAPPLQWLDPAAAAAFLHSLDMSDRDYFDHVNPEGQGPGTRLGLMGVSWSAYAENIAMGYVDADEVMAGWMASEGHRTNLLNPAYTHVGIGVRWAAGGPFWTQDFVRP